LATPHITAVLLAVIRHKIESYLLAPAVLRTLVDYLKLAVPE
jgi:hypothetical protein